MDPISQIYLNVINEATLPDQKVNTNLKIGAAFGDSSNEKNSSTFQKGTGCDNVEGLTTPDEAPDELTCDVDSSVKKVSKESKNPFDRLYYKIISEEESFNFSTKKDNQLEPEELSDSDFDDDSDNDSNDDSDVSEFLNDEDPSSEEVTLTLNKELASELIQILKTALGEDDSDNSDDSSEDDSDDSSEYDTEDDSDSMSFGQMDDVSVDNTKKESFALDDAEELGDALVDVDKLNAGLTNPSNHVVKGNIKASKKHSEVPTTGKNSDGKLKPHNTKSGVSTLMKKNQKVEGGTKEGNFFNNR